MGARLIALFLGLLLVVQLAGLAALQASFARHARSVLPERLHTGSRVLQGLLDRQAQALQDGARLVAADPAFHEQLRSDDAAIIAAALNQHGTRLGATEAALVTPDFQLRASRQPDGTELAALAGRLAAAAATGGRACQVALLGGRAHHVVLVPIKAPQPAGWLLMGKPLDGGLAREMQSLSALQLTLLTQGPDSDAWLPAHSTLAPAQAQTLARHAWRAGQAPATLGAAGAELAVQPLWLTTPDSPGAGAVLAVLSLPLDDALRLPRDVQMALLAISVVGFAAFGLLGVLCVRRVTTPLGRLAAAADRLGAGDVATPVTDGVHRDDELGHLARAFEQMRVGVEHKQKEIVKLAYWDALTGLPNRVQFREALREAIRAAGDSGAPRTTVSVVMIDLDRFKQVNDVLGYRFGDLLLARIAERLSQHTVRGADLVARLGGDEFAVLLRDGGIDVARSVAQRIERAFDTPLTLEDHAIDMGGGIGFACWPQHAFDADTLLSRAEVAMHVAKRRGSGPQPYDPALDASSAQTLSLLSELRHAVDTGELRLLLQPKLALDSGDVVGAETLVRWQHPQRGLLAPPQFIPFAEQTGFIRSLTLWVFEEAARHWGTLESAGMRMPLSVNLSTRDLLDPELPQKLDALLVRHRVPAEAFCLEVTESAIMEDPQRAQATLDRLSALGFKLSIDDFGTGYSSLAHLKRLPVDELKIDKRFVLGMQADADDAKVVRSTIDLAHNLGLSVVAEGVENAAVWERLRELNCDQAQGFHLGRPMAAGEFLQWNARWVTRLRPDVPRGQVVLH